VGIFRQVGEVLMRYRVVSCVTGLVGSLLACGQDQLLMDDVHPDATSITSLKIGCLVTTGLTIAVLWRQVAIPARQCISVE
jgi:hypothetical protein